MNANSLKTVQISALNFVYITHQGWLWMCATQKRHRLKYDVYVPPRHWNFEEDRAECQSFTTVELLP